MSDDTPLIKGKITFEINGVLFTEDISGNEPFINEIANAIDRQENPAKALVFLALIAAKYAHPHIANSMTMHHQGRWKNYFGDGVSGGTKLVTA